MFSQFFKHKMRQVGSFLRIMKGKATKVDRDTKRKNRPNEKILRTEVDRDISAI